MANPLEELRLKLHRILDDPQFDQLPAAAVQEVLIQVGVDRYKGMKYPEVSAEIDALHPLPEQAPQTEVEELAEPAPKKPKSTLGKNKPKKKAR